MSTQETVSDTGLFHEAVIAIRELRAEVDALKEENRRLRKHVLDLYADLETAAKSEPDGLTERERLGEL